MKSYVIQCTKGDKVWFVGKGVKKDNGKKYYNTVNFYKNARMFRTPELAEKTMKKYNSMCANLCWDYKILPYNY